MDSDERALHFEWDLLDAAKQAAIKPALDKSVFGARSRVEIEVLELPRDTSPVAQSSFTQPEPKVVSHDPSALPVRPEPITHAGTFRAGFEPKAGMLPLDISAAEADLPELESDNHPMIAHEPLRIRSDRAIPKLGWSDIGMATEPGQYSSRYGLIQVQENEIWIWKMHPNATFTVMHPSPYSSQNFSQLGSFDLGIGHSALDNK